MRIIADSSCDLYTLDYPDFRTVPLTVYTDERSFLDDDSLNITEMLDYLAGYKGRSYTSCPSAEAWLAAFEGADRNLRLHCDKRSFRIVQQCRSGGRNVSGRTPGREDFHN